MKVWYNVCMSKVRYKVEKLEAGSPEYAIRYSESRREAYAKIKDGKEFKTDFSANNTAYEVYLSGTEVSEKDYAAF